MAFKIATAFVGVSANDEGLHEALKAKIDAAGAGLAFNLGMDLHDEGLRDRVVEAVFAAERGINAIVGIDLDNVDLRQKVIDATAEAEHGIAAIVGIDLDNVDLRGQVIEATKDAERGINAIVGIDLDNVDLRQKVKAAAEEAKTDVKVNVDTSAAQGNVAALTGRVLALLAAAAAVGPALAALPAVAAGGIAAIGTLALGFGAAGNALRDYGQQSQAVGQSQAQLAATAFSSAVAIRGAEQAITDAKTQAARTQITSAEQVANAQQAVGDAGRAAAQATQSSADQIIAASQRVDQAAYSSQQAEHAYTDALWSEQQAQQAVLTARRDAANQLADSKNAAADAKLAVERATLTAAAAERSLAAAQGNSLLNTDQKAAADLAAREAAQQLVDAKQHEIEAQQQATAAAAVGVDQAPSVLAAQHAAAQAAQGVADAQHNIAVAAQGQIDAQRALVKANQDAANQQITSAEQVAGAHQRLTDALRQADQQRVDSTQRVQRAEQSLADTVEQQHLQAAAAAASASAAANKFAKDMAALTPAGREFDTTVLGMKGVLHELSAEAQTATLPGFTSMLRNSNALLPVVSSAVRGFGGDLSNTAAAFGHLFANPAFDASAQQFTNLIVSGFGQFASALPQLLKGIVDAGVQAGPIIDAVAGGIHDVVASGLPAFLSGLSSGAGGAAQGIGALLRTVDDLLGPVGTLAGGVAGALGPAFADLEPEVKTLADEIVHSLMPIMPELGADLKDVADAAVAILKILEPLIPIIAQDLGAALHAVDPLLRDTATFLHDNQKWLTPVAEGILAMVAATKAWNLVGTGMQSGTKQLSKLLDDFSGNAKGAGKASAEWGAAVGGAAGSLSKTLPVIGQVLTAAGLLGNELGHLAGVGDHTGQNINDLTTKLYDAAHGSDEAQRQMAQLATGMGLASDKMGGTVQGAKDVDSALTALYSSDAPAATAEFGKLSAAMEANGLNAAQVAKLFPQYTAALSDASTQAHLAGGHTGDLASATKNAADTAERSAQPFSGLALHLDAVDRGGKNSAQDLQALDGALHNIDSRLQNQQALDDYAKNLNSIKDGASGATREISGNSQAAIDNRAQLDQAVESLRRVYDSQIALHTPIDQANRNFQDQVDKLRAVAEKTYGSKDAVDHYLDSLGLIPPTKTTKITADSQDGVKTIREWQTEIDALHGPHIDLHIEHIYGPGDQEITMTATRVSARAEGGPMEAGQPYWVGERGPELVIPTGPGTVIPTSQIRQVGGTTPQPAAPVTKPPITINFYGTQLPTAEQQADMMRQLSAAVTG